MGFKSSRSRRSTNSDTDSESSTSRARTVDRMRSEDGAPPSSFRSEEHFEAYYGVPYEGNEQLQRLQYKESKFGDRIFHWLEEGMPIEAMGLIEPMERFRERRGTPVPWNVEEHNEQSVQRSTEAAADTLPAGEAGVPDTVREVISSPGRSLDSSIQSALEDRMGDSLGDVRIHTGPEAAQACELIDARAFTVGNHVAFNQGEYDPSSAEGQHVLAHELPHVRQQTGGDIHRLPKSSDGLRGFEDGYTDASLRPSADGAAGIAVQRSTESATFDHSVFDGKLQEALDHIDESATVAFVAPSTSLWGDSASRISIRGWSELHSNATQKK